MPGPVTTPDDLANADGVLKELLFHEMLARGIYLAGRGFVAMSLAIGDPERPCRDCHRAAGVRHGNDGKFTIA